MNSNVVLSCNQLGKTFSEGGLVVDVLKDISLSVVRGERVAIVGTSGAGKSTLLHLLGGLDTPSRGEVWVNHQNMAQLSEVQRGRLRNQSLGFIYQFHHLLAEFTALENVAMPLLIRDIAPIEGAAVSFRLPEEQVSGVFSNGLRTDVVVSGGAGAATGASAASGAAAVIAADAGASGEALDGTSLLRQLQML